MNRKKPAADHPWKTPVVASAVPPDKTRLEVRVNDTMREQLNDIASRTGQTITGIVRIAIYEMWERTQQKTVLAQKKERPLHKTYLCAACGHRGAYMGDPREVTCLICDKPIAIEHYMDEG